MTLEKAFQELRCREFKEADLIWAQFIANNRNGFRYARMMTMSENNLRGQYELVIGQIADGQFPVLHVFYRLRCKL